MAINNLPISASLKLMVQEGLDEKGAPIIKSRNYNRVKPEASDQGIYNAADSLGSLQEHPVNSIRRITESELVSNE